MPRRLREELQQKRPFPTLEEEVFVEIQRTAQATTRWVVEALKPTGLTPPQFNVLRILRGARPEPLSSCGIAERMIAFDPDLTRLLDRLEARGLVRKARDDRDRRVVSVHITQEGLELVESGTQAVRARLKAAMAHAGPRKLDTLADLLEMVRGAPD
jgi:DNA-binding MarR family transcriptional regulator